jgi:DUF2407 C-terminal domain
MKDYGVMNEEQLNQTPVIISSVYEENDENNQSKFITVYLKVTDSDIRNIEINPNIETVGTLKNKVFYIQVFFKEILENFKIRMIYSGRIMLDTQNLSIYSKHYIELSDKAYIHAVITSATPNDNLAPKKESYKGFDKLESSGFNVDDVHNLRFHFHAMCIYTGLNKQEDEDKIELEDQWLDGKIPAINANLQDRSIILLTKVT